MIPINFYQEQTMCGTDDTVAFKCYAIQKCSMNCRGG